MFINTVWPCPSPRPGAEIQVVCRCRTGRGLPRKMRKRRRKRRGVTGKRLLLTPFTLHLWFKVLTPTAALGCHHPPPYPPLTCIVTCPAPPTPPPPLLPVTLLLLLLRPPPITISALLPPRCSISSVSAQCQKVCLHCQEMEVCTTIRSPSQHSTTQTRTRECSSTTICPVRDPSRSRTLFKASGSKQPKSRLSEPVSPVPLLTPA